MSTDTTSTGPKLDAATDFVVRMDPGDQAISSLNWTHPPNIPPMLSYTTWMGGFGVYSIQKNADNTIVSSPIVSMTAPKSTTCVLNKNTQQAGSTFGAVASNPQERFAPNSSSLPLLCSTLTENGDFFTGGCSGCVCYYDLKALGGGASLEESYRIVARHSRPVNAIAMLPDSPLLVTASWDKSVRVWDLRQSVPNATSPLFHSTGADGSVAQFQCSGPLSDLKIDFARTSTTPSGAGFNVQVNAQQAPHKGIALCSREATLIDFSKMQVIKTIKPLPVIRNQMACATILVNDQQTPYGCAVGCRDGRTMVKVLDEETANFFPRGAQATSSSKVPKSFSFVAHKIEKQANLRTPNAATPGLYPVNAVHAHPQFPYTVLTAGANGSVKTWDVEKRSLIKAFDYGYQPITAAKFSGSGGDMLALALGYDWSRGAQNFNTGKPGGIIVKALRLEDVQSK